MKTRLFGRTGLHVSELCLSVTNFARHTNQDEAFAMLDAFREAGGNMIQTSGICPGCSLGDNVLGLAEEFVGRWLAARNVPRDELVIATRVALARPMIGGSDGYAELVAGCARDSVRRMRCGHLDLLFIEWTDAVLPLDDSVAAFNAAVHGGVTRYIAAAHFPVAPLREALATTGQDRPGAFSAVQEDYSLVCRALFERRLARLCGDFNLGFVARSPLAGGRLIGYPLSDLGSFHRRGADNPAIATAATGLWPLLSALARPGRDPAPPFSRRSCEPAAVAVAWVLAQPGVDSVLISVRSESQLRALLESARILFSTEELDRLDRASTLAPTTVGG